MKTLRVDSTYQKKFDTFLEIPVQSNKAVLAQFHESWVKYLQLKRVLSNMSKSTPKLEPSN